MNKPGPFTLCNRPVLGELSELTSSLGGRIDARPKPSCCAHVERSLWQALQTIGIYGEHLATRCDMKTGFIRG